MSRDPSKTGVRLPLARCGLAALVLVAFAWQAGAADYTLERVVLVSRQGVPAPTDSTKLVEYTRSKS
jgi:hypothetical protein